MISRIRSPFYIFFIILFMLLLARYARSAAIISIRAKMTSFTRPIFRAFCCRPIFRASFSRPYISFGWNGNATQEKISWTCTDVFRVNENFIQQLSVTFSCRDSKDGELSYLVTHVMSFSTNQKVQSLYSPLKIVM